MIRTVLIRDGAIVADQTEFVPYRETPPPPQYRPTRRTPSQEWRDRLAVVRAGLGDWYVIAEGRSYCVGGNVDTLRQTHRDLEFVTRYDRRNDALKLYARLRTERVQPPGAVS